MTDAELGKATIVYEDPDGETVEETVDNEHVAYVQDHWIVKTDEGEEGRDTVLRIPATRVYYVERDVEAFEEEVRTVRDQVQSFASDLGGEVRTLRDRIESMAGGIQRERRGGDGSEAPEEAEPIEIQVGEGGESRAAGSSTGESSTGSTSVGGSSTDENVTGGTTTGESSAEESTTDSSDDDSDEDVDESL